VTRTPFKLTDFQAEDVRLIARAGRGAIASEMGTGKTHEGIALDGYWYAAAKVKGPTLVVCPINVFGSWVQKYKMQSPETDVYVIDRKDRGAFVKALKAGKADVYIMHWDALRLIPELSKIKFLTVIADEAHRASNRKAQAPQALKRIQATHKLAMSGTMSGDQPQNLWSIFNWLWPKTYTSFWKFDKHYVVREQDARGYTVVKGVKNVESLAKEISPWYVRHLKKEKCCEHHPDGVMSYLPDKTYDAIWVELGPTQRKIYNQMKEQMVAWIGEHEDSPLVASIAVAQMTRLSQMALATPEIRIEKRRKRDTGEIIDVQVVHLKLPSSKLEALLDLLNDHPDKKFVVWSASKKMCYLVSKALNEKGIGNHVLSGDTPQSQRDTMVEDFITDDRRVFLGVIAAAGEAIDGLQKATDTAIFLDRSWSTKSNKQAEDRLHRPGQDGNKVQIIDIMAKDTVDLGRHTRLAEKWHFIKAILGDKIDQESGQLKPGTILEG
jgi:SNF2 family DNA or RNA helicase